MSYQTLLFDVVGDIATLTLNRPATLNALTGAMQQEMLAVLARVRDEPTIRALIVTGAGRAFCSGASLEAMIPAPGDPATPGEVAGRLMREVANPLVLALHSLPLPVICAMNGTAAGGGIGIALACDIVLAAHSATFALTFTPKLGLIPDLGVSWHLPRAIGWARALALTLTGKRITAAEAVKWGLIWGCVDDEALAGEARDLALRLARLPSHAITEVRDIYILSETATLIEQLEHEAIHQSSLLDRDSFREGVKAFFDRREPVFKARQFVSHPDDLL
ncbi:enoyl-CoA hydratase-related protein [Paraburkholderia metrosideri]|uniref:Enoyl-CoA hydratase-related protein n=1 Tax=Paraburkholderia metrosideri TaxID=580937 RepID=A0ABW9E302_9BURK